MKRDSIQALVKRLQRQRLRRAKVDAQLKGIDDRLRKTQLKIISKMAEMDEVRIGWEGNRHCIVKKKVSRMRQFSPRILLEVAGEAAFDALYARAGKVDQMLPTLPQDKQEQIVSSITYRNTRPYVVLSFVKIRKPSQEPEIDRTPIPSATT